MLKEADSEAENMRGRVVDVLWRRGEEDGGGEGGFGEDIGDDLLALEGGEDGRKRVCGHHSICWDGGGMSSNLSIMHRGRDGEKVLRSRSAVQLTPPTCPPGFPVRLFRAPDGCRRPCTLGTSAGSDASSTRSTGVLSSLETPESGRSAYVQRYPHLHAADAFYSPLYVYPQRVSAGLQI